MTNTNPQRPTAGGRYYKQPDGSLLPEAEASAAPKLTTQPSTTEAASADPGKAGKRGRFHNERTTEDDASTEASSEDTGA